MVSEFQELTIELDPARGWVCQGMAYNSTPQGHRILALDFRGAAAIIIGGEGTVATLSADKQREIVQMILGFVVDAVIEQNQGR